MCIRDRCGSEAIAQWQRLPPEEATNQMPRRRPRRAGQRRRPSSPISHRQPKCGIEWREIDRADDAQKIVRLAITTEERVLTVIEPLPGLAIGERRRTAAQPGRFFDDRHRLAAHSEAHCGAQTREACANDHDVARVSVAGFGHGEAPTMCGGPAAPAPGVALARAG